VVGVEHFLVDRFVVDDESGLCPVVGLGNEKQGGADQSRHDDSSDEAFVHVVFHYFLGLACPVSWNSPSAHAGCGKDGVFTEVEFDRFTLEHPILVQLGGEY
jgi:hypothetical protein